LADLGSPPDSVELAWKDEAAKNQRIAPWKGSQLYTMER